MIDNAQLPLFRPGWKTLVNLAGSEFLRFPNNKVIFKKKDLFSLLFITFKCCLVFKWIILLNFQLVRLAKDANEQPLVRSVKIPSWKFLRHHRLVSQVFVSIADLSSFHKILSCLPNCFAPKGIPGIFLRIQGLTSTAASQSRSFARTSSDLLLLSGYRLRKYIFTMCEKIHL